MAGPLLLRHFDASLRAGDDGRTVYGRVVPFNQPIEFDDGPEDDNHGREMFVRGSLERIIPAWHRVGLYFTHRDHFENLIGRGDHLEEREDGAYASFRLIAATAAKAREVLADTHRGLSLGFFSLRHHLDDAGVWVRERVGVAHVAAVIQGAYPTAAILAIRDAQNGSYGDRHAPGVDAPTDGPDGSQRAPQPAQRPNLDGALADIAELTMSPQERYQRDDLARRAAKP